MYDMFPCKVVNITDVTC